MNPPSSTQTTEIHSPSWRREVPPDVTSGMNFCTLLLTIPQGQVSLSVPVRKYEYWQDTFATMNMLPLLLTIPHGQQLFPNTLPFVTYRQDFIQGMNVNTQSLLPIGLATLLPPENRLIYKQETSVPLNLSSLTPLLTMFGPLGQPLTPPLFPNPYMYAMSPGLFLQLTQNRSNLVDTMFGASGEPLKGNIIPNPMVFRPSVSLLTHTESTKLNLTGQDTFFSAAGIVPTHDWPNPNSHNYSIELRTFLHSVILELIGQDTIFGGAGVPIPVTSWMIPQLRIATPDTQGIILFQMPLVLAIVPIVPPSARITTIINELEFGPTFITRVIELLRNQ